MFLAIYRKYVLPISDLLYLGSILALPLVDLGFIRISSLLEKKIFFISYTAIWVLIKSPVLRLRFSKRSIFPIAFTIYFSLNFFLLSNFSGYHIHFWLVVSYFLVYLVSTHDSSCPAEYWQNINKFALFWGVIFIAYWQMILSVLQLLELYPVGSPFFDFTGGFHNPGLLGSYLAISLLIVISYYLSKHQNYLSTWLFLVLISPIIVLLIMTKARAAWVGLLAGLAVIFFLRNKQWIFDKVRRLGKARVIVVAVGSVILLFTGLLVLKPDSAVGRILIAKLSVISLKSDALFGHGAFNFPGVYNNFKTAYFSLQPRPWHEMKVADYVSTAFNDWLLLLVETGIAGVVLFSLALLSYFKSKKFEHDQPGILAGLLVIGFFTTVYQYTTLMALALIATFPTRTSQGENHTSLPFLPFAAGIISLSFVMLFVVFQILQVGERKWDFNSKNPSTKPRTNTYAQALDVYGWNAPFHLGHAQILKKSGKKRAAIDHLHRHLKLFGDRKAATNLLSYPDSLIPANEKISLMEYKANSIPYGLLDKIKLVKMYQKQKKYKKADSMALVVINMPIKFPSELADKIKKRASIYHKSLSRRLETVERFGYLRHALVIDSKFLKRKIRSVIYEPESKIDQKLPTIYFNDGHQYTGRGRTIEKIDSLIKAKCIKPIRAVFVDPRDPDSIRVNRRQEYFLCNTGFVKFFEKELIPKTESDSDGCERGLAGLSFGGLAAAFLAKHSTAFEFVAMQSPAFHPCKEIYQHYDSPPGNIQKMYVSYGTGGRDTESQTKPFLYQIKKNDYPLRLHVVQNGHHNWIEWEKQLNDILLYFYGE